MTTKQNYLTALSKLDKTHRLWVEKYVAGMYGREEVIEAIADSSHESYSDSSSNDYSSSSSSDSSSYSSSDSSSYDSGSSGFDSSSGGSSSDW